MDRRTVLQALAGGAGLVLAGCTSRDAVPSPQSSPETTAGGGTTTRAGVTEPRTTPASATTVDPRRHAVSVTKRVEQGQRDLARVVRVADGRVEYDLTCPDGASKTATADLSAERRLAFERSVLAADPDRLASAYECSGDCPQDLPQTRLAITIDGESTEVRIEAAAEIPAALDVVLTDLESFEEMLDGPTCE
ncbi:MULTISPECIES: hypothetical protein [Halorussus]|uniref:hypothetical protein n=1 Tax=Halorussus TaxID=1070314 RepID=UPI000E219E23|nr:MULTISPECIES: hypothetical protein [Halorussus]NHN58953.1 hypothetical protein [Halorussus sp. JP-T4]